jgi:hypothetical protein
VSSRLGGPLLRTAIAAVVGVGVFAAQAVQPLSAANAQTTASAHAAPRRTPVNLHPPKVQLKPWAATAKPARREPKAPDVAKLRQEALTQAGKTEKYASYQVSPAVLTYLAKGLGMSLGGQTTLRGVRSGANLDIGLPAPASLRLGLPAGVRAPSFGRATLTVNRETGAATLTASAANTDATLRILIPDAAGASLAGLAGRLTMRAGVLGETVTLSGPVSDHTGQSAAASLSGRLPAAAGLKSGVADVAAGAAVTLSPATGLRVAGPASLGPAGRQFGVTVTGTITARDSWTFTVTSADGRTPLPGLDVSPAASGTITERHGDVSFAVRARTAKPLAVADGATVSGTVEFSNILPNALWVPAPAIAAWTPWVDVTGTVTLASGTQTRGTAAVNLASGDGVLASTAAAAMTATQSTGTQSTGTQSTGTQATGKLTLDHAGFLSRISVGAHGLTGTVRGTGVVTRDVAGKQVKSAAALTVTTGGVVASVRGGTSQAPPALTSGRSAKMANSGDPSTSYGLSSSVYNFLTQTLNIPLSSQTVTGTLNGSTLTLTAGAPTALPSSLPSWLPNPSYANTELSIDESTGTLTLTAATGTASGLAGTLTVTVANAGTSTLTDGTDISGSLALTGVPFAGGSQASLTFTLGYSSAGTLTATATGGLTSAATFANGAVTIPAATLSLAAGSGLTISGTAQINAGTSSSPSSATVNVSGTLTDLSDWSLTVSDAYAGTWTPASGLTVTNPDFTGSISDTAGTVGFDLSVSGASGPAATWVSPDQSSSVTVTGLEVSNEAPSSTASCMTTEAKDGDLWIGAAGMFSYAPAGLSLQANGCFNVTAGIATITTAATGDLTSEFGNSLPFEVTGAGLTASVSASGAYSLTGTASAQITAGVSADPSFNVGLRLSSDGIIGAVGLPSLGEFGIPGLSGSGVLYVATAEFSDVNPADFGITGQPGDSVTVPQGLSLSLSYTLPTALTNLIPGLTASAANSGPVQTMATLSSTGFTVSLTVPFGSGANGLQIAAYDGAAAYLNGVTFTLALGDAVSASISGNGYLELPVLVPGGSPSATGITVAGSLSTGNGLSLSLDAQNWHNAFSVTNLDVGNLGGAIGITADGLPSIQVSGSGITLPEQWSDPIGLVNGTEISFNADLSTTAPALSFSFTNPNGIGPGYPVLTPLAIDPDMSQTVVNSFTVNEASFNLAPLGGTTVGGQSIPQGFSLLFNADIAGVTVNVSAAVDVSATSPSVTANVSAPSFPVGPAQVSGTQFYLNLSPENASFGITGGMAYNGDSYDVNIQFWLGTTMNAADIWLWASAGLPSYFGGVELSGSVSGTGSGASVYATGYGYLDFNGNTFSVGFTLNLPGQLDWDVNSIVQLAQYLADETSLDATQIANMLISFGYDTYDILNALGNLGDWSSSILSDLANAFGFSTEYYDIWNETSSGSPLVMDVDGASQSPSTNVITWVYDAGYNQDWAFVPDPEYPGYYAIVNEGSGQCLTVQYNTSTPGNDLVQYPCNGGYNQLWYMGYVATGTYYVISSKLDGEVADIQNAYPWQGGYLDQWTANGGWNQVFYLTNSSVYNG